MTYGVDWVCECGWANLDVRKHCRKCGVPRSLSEVPALEALAGRQVAVTEEMVGKGIEGWHRSLIDAPDEDVDARRDRCIRATLEAALTATPPAPQAAEGATLVDQMPDEFFDEDHSDENPTVIDTDDLIEPASGKVEAEAVERWADAAFAMEVRPDGQWVRYSDHEATVAAMQAEIERLTALLDEARSLHNHQVHRAEVAEAELAKLQGKIEKITFDMPESYYRTQLRALLKGETE